MFKLVSQELARALRLFLLFEGHFYASASVRVNNFSVFCSNT